MTTPNNPTVRDVAVRAQVSRATASRVLGGYGYSSPDVRERVLTAADALGYHPNQAARSMRSGRSQIIGFVCSDISDRFFSTAMRGICDVAEAAGYQVIVINSDDKLDGERAGVQSLISHQVDGIIVSPVSPSHAEHLAELAEAGPLVALDRPLTLDRVDSVVTDNRHAADSAVTRIINAGHTRIALLASAQPEEQPKLRRSGGGFTVQGTTRPATDRARGYLDAHRRHQIHVDRRAVLFSPQDQYEERIGAITHLLREARPTALFTTDSSMTTAAYQSVMASGLSIPDDVSLVGFDDFEWTTLVVPNISVVVQPAREMGRTAAELLIARIEGSVKPGRNAVIPTSYESRDSLLSV